MPKIQPMGAPATQIKAQTQPVDYKKMADNQAKTVEAISQKQPDGKEAAPAQQVKTEAKVLPPEFEAIAKKESAIRTREMQLKQREAEMDAKIQEAVSKALGEYKSRLKTAPLDTLNEEGLTYDQLVEQALNQPDPQTRAIEKKLSTIEENQRRMAEDAKKQADAQREGAIKQIRYDVEDLVNSDPEFETIKTTGSYDDVVELITRTFDQTGRLMTVDQAAKLVENELFEEAVKIANIGKVKAKFQPSLADAVTKQSSQPQQATTLTNDMTANRKMTARERAIAAFEGRLNKTK